MKQVFIGIMAEIIGERLAYIGTSVNRSLRPEPGETINTKDALAFLHSLYTLKDVYAKQDKAARLVWYAATRDVEMIARDLPKAEKDRLFPSEEILEQRRQMWLEREAAEIEIARTLDDDRIKELGARLREIKAQSKQLEYVWPTVNGIAIGYRVQYHQGKTLAIGKCGSENDKARNLVTIYDLLSFFRCPLSKAAREHLKIDLTPVDQSMRKVPLWERAITDAVIAQNRRECEALAALGEKLRGYFADSSIYLQQWYGPSAAANYCLNRWGVRDQFRPVTRANSPRLLTHAIDRAMYGGRIELLKVGTVAPVNVYDLNAAYAYAICLLGKATGRWLYSKKYAANEPFSVWRVDYDLRSEPDPYIGPLPHRSVTGGVCWRRSGRGYFWQPEVAAAIARYGDAIKVDHGYVMPYEPIEFAGYIATLYEHRLALQKERNPAQLALKLLLASLYGKFAQQIGEPRFQFKPWAGWVTSYVRAQLLKAIAGREHEVIGFAQDAVHTTGELDVPISDRMGEWKLSQWETGFYLAPGIYELNAPGKVRRAMRGFEQIDFAAAREQLKQGATFSGQRDFFVGWRLAQTFPLEHGGSYLQKKSERFTLRPTEYKARQFPPARIDFSQTHCDSGLCTWDDGRESAERRDVRWLLRVFDMMIDVIKARRYENV